MRSPASSLTVKLLSGSDLLGDDPRDKVEDPSQTALDNDAVSVDSRACFLRCPLSFPTYRRPHVYLDESGAAVYRPMCPGLRGRKFQYGGSKYYRH